MQLGLSYDKQRNVFVPMDAIQAEEMYLSLEEGLYIAEVQQATEKATRTIKQNNSLWLWCRKLATAFNDGGYDMRKVFELMKNGYEIPWTKDGVKEYLWNPIMEATTGKKSSTKLNTKEPSEIYIILDKFTSEKLKVSIAWPDIHGQSLEKYDE